MHPKGQPPWIKKKTMGGIDIGHSLGVWLDSMPESEIQL